MKQGFFWLLAALGGAALFAAACAPAAEPAEQQTTPSQTAPQQAAPKPEIQQAQPIKQEAVRKEEAKPPEAGVKTSVSGIPLDPNAKRGGVLAISGPTSEGPSFSTWEEAAGIPFAAAHPVSNMIVQNRTWGTLDDFKANRFFEIHPDLAKSWESSADGLAWTFKFRDGVKWSDGVPFTCADAKWSLDTIRTAKGLLRSPRATHFLPVKEVRCADDLTMVISLSRPKAGFLEVVGMAYHVVRPKHVYENNTEALRKEPPKVGTGPFRVKERLPGEKIVFERNPNYWDQPLPYLDGIELRVLANPAIDAAMLGGRLDIPSPLGYSGARAERLLKECKVCSFWPRLAASSLTQLMVNHQRPPWNQPEMKDAISYALDRQKLVDVVTLGWSLVPKAGPFYPGGPWAMPYERVQQVPGFNFQDPEGNKQKARELLAKAGYKANELKVTVNFWLPTQDNIPVIIEDLKAVGIDATSRVMADAENYSVLTAGDFDIHLHGFFVAGLDPDVVLYEQYYTGSDRNYNRYSNPRYDALVNQMSQTLDPERRKQLAWDAGELVLREHAKFILATGSFMPVNHSRLRGYFAGINYLASYGPLNRWQSVWLDETK